MAVPSAPPHYRFFIARADWTDDSQYGEHLCDPSIAAWELLRRNSQYVHDYQQWHHRLGDVLPKPLPKQSLVHYYCNPEAGSASMTYSDYVLRYPDHSVCPVQDHIRERWGINEMPNPEHGWQDILDNRDKYDQDNKLAWLFACNTVQVINSPNIWPTKSYLHTQTLLTEVSDFCTGTEVLVRLDFTGNLEEQIESLRRQIDEFFVGGSRQGKALAQDPRSLNRIEDQVELVRAPFIQQVQQQFLAVHPDWNDDPPARRKSLPCLVRLADALAAMEHGTLIAQLEREDIECKHLRFDTDGDEQPLASFVVHVRLREPLRLVLLQYFGKKGNDIGLDQRTISTLLDTAFNAVARGRHTWIARGNLRKRVREAKKKK